jgi:predicted porin
MKKTIIAAAVAASFVAPVVAMADVTVYGRLDAEVNNSEDANGLDSAGSRIGFKGSEDLGNGLKAGFVYEVKAGVDNAGNGMEDLRTASVSLSGDFGTVAAGQLYAPTKVFLGVAEMAGDTLIDQSTMVAGATANSEITGGNAVAYMNDFGPVHVVVGVNRSETATGAGSEDGKFYGVKYSANGLTLAAAGFDKGNATCGSATNAATCDQTVFSASYTMGGLTVAAATQDTELHGDQTSASIGYTMGNNKIVATWGEYDKDGSTAAKDGSGVALIHNLSKTTKVYVAVRDTDANSADTTTGSSAAVGMQMAF